MAGLLPVKNTGAKRPEELAISLPNRRYVPFGPVQIDHTPLQALGQKGQGSDPESPATTGRPRSKKTGVLLGNPLQFGLGFNQ